MALSYVIIYPETMDYKNLLTPGFKGSKCTLAFSGKSGSKACLHKGNFFSPSKKPQW